MCFSLWNSAIRQYEDIGFVVGMNKMSVEPAAIEA
jgi:hypothetical protein